MDCFIQQNNLNRNLAIKVLYALAAELGIKLYKW